MLNCLKPCKLLSAVISIIVVQIPVYVKYELCKMWDIFWNSDWEEHLNMGKLTYFVRKLEHWGWIFFVFFVGQAA
jgi:hypothetical protein